MRRITTKYAQLGMVLGTPVYDNYGKELLGRYTTITDQCLNIMSRNRVSEILIEDERVDDLVVAPMVSPKVEGRLIVVFQEFINTVRETHGIDGNTMLKLNLTVNEIARDLSLTILGEINVSCFTSQEDYTYIKPVKSAILSMALGQRMGLPKNDLVILGMGSLLKDIGYTCMPSGIINQSNPAGNGKMLTNHPVWSYDLLKQSSNINVEIANAVLQHHENWGGGGYPQGLKAQQISAYAQIIAISDAYSDLLVSQSGKQRYMSHEAIEYIMASSGDLFDPKLVETFVRKIPAYSTGLTVKLNSGEIGIISDSNIRFIARPVVRIFYDPEKGNLKKPYDINLAKSEFQTKLINKVLEYD